ncbi:PCRF domain-containing protein [Oligoflexia bacterium]|nr:PCRF domain-containing protein [Oligoflexia bacterium]
MTERAETQKREGALRVLADSLSGSDPSLEGAIADLAQAQFEAMEPELAEAVADTKRANILSAQARFDITVEAMRRAKDDRASLRAQVRQIGSFIQLLDQKQDAVEGFVRRFPNSLADEVVALDREIKRILLPKHPDDPIPHAPDRWERTALAVGGNLVDGFLKNSSKSIEQYKAFEAVLERLTSLFERVEQSHVLKKASSLSGALSCLAEKRAALAEVKESFKRLGPRGKIVYLVGDVTRNATIIYTAGSPVEAVQLTARLRRGSREELFVSTLSIAAQAITFHRNVGSMAELREFFFDFAQALSEVGDELENNYVTEVIAEREQALKREEREVRAELHQEVEALAQVVVEDLSADLEGLLLRYARPQLFHDQTTGNAEKTVRRGAYNLLLSRPFGELEAAEQALVKMGLIPHQSDTHASHRMRSEVGSLLAGSGYSSHTVGKVLNADGLQGLRGKVTHWDGLRRELRIGERNADFFRSNTRIFTGSKEEIVRYKDRLRAFVAVLNESPVREQFNLRTNPELVRFSQLENTIAKHRSALIRHYLENSHIQIDIEPLLNSGISAGAVYRGLRLLTTDCKPLCDPRFGAELLAQDPDILTHPDLEHYLTEVAELHADILAAPNSVTQYPNCPDPDMAFAFIPENLLSARQGFEKAKEADDSETLQFYYAVAGFEPQADTTLLSLAEVESRTATMVTVLRRGGIRQSDAEALIENTLWQNGVIADLFFVEDPERLGAFEGETGTDRFHSYTKAIGALVANISRQRGALIVEDGYFDIGNNPTAFTPEQIRNTSRRFAELIAGEGRVKEADIVVIDSLIHASGDVPLSAALLERLAGLERRYWYLNVLLEDPLVAADPRHNRMFSKEMGDIDRTLQFFKRYCEAHTRIMQNLKPNGGYREQARELDELEQRLVRRVVERDPVFERDAVVEIKVLQGGGRGEEFAEELMGAYRSFLVNRGFEVTVAYQQSGAGEHGHRPGLNEVRFEVAGKHAYGLLVHEVGTHSFRSLAAGTERKRVAGRCTVAVFPQLESEEVELRDEDIRIDTMRSSGAGGQHVNKTESCVRFVHQPTGTTVVMQEERSQTRNREKARKVLAAMLYADEKKVHEEALVAERRAQIGRGARAGGIRVYNFYEGRVTDSRLPSGLEGRTMSIEDFKRGRLGKMVDALHRWQIDESLRALSHTQP